MPGFGELLKRARDASLLSQRELAEKADVSIEAISLWERERVAPREDSARRLAEALSLEPNDAAQFVELARLARRQQRRDWPGDVNSPPAAQIEPLPANRDSLAATGPRSRWAAALPRWPVVAGVLVLGLVGGLAANLLVSRAQAPASSARQDPAALGSPPCAGTACDGLDPGATGCAAYGATPEHIEYTDGQGTSLGWVELRWSDFCQTNWARVEDVTGDASVPLRAYLRDETGAVIDATTVEDSATGIYSNMVFAPTGVVRVKACGTIGQHGEVCTGFH